jgi:hypothetical protein
MTDEPAQDPEASDAEAAEGEGKKIPEWLPTPEAARNHLNGLLALPSDFKDHPIYEKLWRQACFATPPNLSTLRQRLGRELLKLLAKLPDDQARDFYWELCERPDIESFEKYGFPQVVARIATGGKRREHQLERALESEQEAHGKTRLELQNVREALENLELQIQQLTREQPGSDRRNVARLPGPDGKAKWLSIALLLACVAIIVLVARLALENVPDRASGRASASAGSPMLMSAAAPEPRTTAPIDSTSPWLQASLAADAGAPIVLFAREAPHSNYLDLGRALSESLGAGKLFVGGVDALQNAEALLAHPCGKTCDVFALVEDNTFSSKQLREGFERLCERVGCRGRVGPAQGRQEQEGERKDDVWKSYMVAQPYLEKLHIFYRCDRLTQELKSKAMKLARKPGWGCPSLTLGSALGKEVFKEAMRKNAVAIRGSALNLYLPELARIAGAGSKPAPQASGMDPLNALEASEKYWIAMFVVGRRSDIAHSHADLGMIGVDRALVSIDTQKAELVYDGESVETIGAYAAIVAHPRASAAAKKKLRYALCELGGAGRPKTHAALSAAEHAAMKQLLFDELRLSDPVIRRGADSACGDIQKQGDAD